jgi:hypothetical protein
VELGHWAYPELGAELLPVVRLIGVAGAGVGAAVEYGAVVAGLAAEPVEPAVEPGPVAVAVAVAAVAVAAAEPAAVDAVDGPVAPAPAPVAAVDVDVASAGSPKQSKLVKDLNVGSVGRRLSGLSFGRMSPHSNT